MVVGLGISGLSILLLLSDLTEVDLLIGDPLKAKNKLGWVPEHDLASLVKDMMDGDVMLMKKDLDSLKAGHEILKQAE